MYVKERYTLPERIKKHLYSLKPNFGFNGYGETVFYTRYSRTKADGTQESWADVVVRCIEGVLSIRKDWYLKTHTEWDQEYWDDFAFGFATFLFDMKYLPPGRGLWAMGTDFTYERGSMALQNCFSGETRIIANGWPQPLKNLVGQSVEVLTGSGPQKAKISSFGKQDLFKIVFKKPGRSKYILAYEATADHRWILSDGTQTTSLKVGDKVKIKPGKVNKESQEYEEGFAHGIVFADGCNVRGNIYSLALFGWKRDYAGWIKNSTFYSHTTKTEIILETVAKLKETPDPQTSIEYRQGFFDAWSMFDGHWDNDISYCVDTTDTYAVDWLITHAGVLDYVVTGYTVDNNPTNFGERNNPLNRVIVSFKEVEMAVQSISYSGKEEVFCATEPKTNTFMLSGGLITGNCGFKIIGSSTMGQDLYWVMDALMCGVGVGFLAERDDDLKVYKPTGEMVYRVPDSREGWCKVVQLKIESYLYPSKPHIVADVQDVRPKGLPIKGFGGVSSGPEPLVQLLADVDMFFGMFLEHDWYDSVMLKTDLCNATGCCVIAGNVRRSAELGCGSIHDTVFLNLKDYKKYPYRENFGWMSNNSAILSEADDYLMLGEIARRVLQNGEPGIINQVNMVKGRVGKDDGLRKDKAIGFNPCLTYSSKILTADGRGYVPIGELADKGQDLDVFCISERDELIVKRMRNPRKTGINQKIYKVTFDDGSTLRCTGNHRIMLRDRSFKEVRDLKFNDSVAIVNRYDSKESKEGTYWQDYVQLGISGTINFEHRLIAENKYGYIDSTEHVHHLNGDKKDNRPNNLELKEVTEHLTDHSEGENNPNFSGISNEEMFLIGVELCRKLGRRFSKNEWEIKGPSFESDYRKNYFGDFLQFASMCADQADVLNEPVDPRTLRVYLDMQNQGYSSKISDGTVFVEKTCECCKSKFWIDQARREQAACSLTCGNGLRDYSKNVEGQRKFFATRRESLGKKQLDLYTELKTHLQREPLKKEWQEFCKNYETSSELGREGSPFKSWDSLKHHAKDHNHRVISVVEDGFEDVYNGTVDDYHNFVVKICDGESTIFNIERGVVTPQCGEQPLEDGELCCLVETVPNRCTGEDGHFDLDTWLKACEYATFYASTVTLLPTHHNVTNRVMARNRRIGVSIMGYTTWVAREEQYNVINYLRAGYNTIREFNRHYNAEAGIPESIRVTTVKPGGTTPKLAGEISGMSFKNFEYMLRRHRQAADSSLSQALIDAGVPYEKDVVSANTLVFEFPLYIEGSKEAFKASLWEQAQNLITLQREWSDNAVSNTLNFRPSWPMIERIECTDDNVWDKLKEVSARYGIDFYSGLTYQSKYEFANHRAEVVKKWGKTEIKIYRYDPSHEEDSVELVLSSTVPHIKSLSLLPHSSYGVYQQMPEEGISKAEYEKRLAAIRPIDWTTVRHNVAQPEIFCTSEVCERPV